MVPACPAVRKSAATCELCYGNCVQTGSWFELKNGNPVFGVLKPDNPFWGIILGFFGVSGYPTAGMPAVHCDYFCIGVWHVWYDVQKGC